MVPGCSLRRAAFLALLLVGVADCQRDSSPHASPPPEPLAPAATALPAAPPDAPDSSASLPPLSGDWISRWSLPSGSVVYVTRPQGATGPRPVILAAHGAEDRPDWACSEWRATVGGYAWVLCPQGVPLRTGYAWPSAEAIAKQGFEARDALRARYPAYVAEGPMLLAGFSQGATLASSVVAAHPGDFDRVVMVEAGHTPISADGVIYGLKKGKVERAILSCSTRGCDAFLGELTRAAAKGGFALLTNDVGLRGHVFDGEVMRTLGVEMVKLVEGDERYGGLGEAVAGR